MISCSKVDGYRVKVNIPDKPLVDGSVLAESDRMIIDDKYIYIRINSKHTIWKVVDRMNHEVLGDESNA